MIELRTLGSVELRSADGRELQAILRQPKRLALLVYLALAGPQRFRRRDTILALFWPELDGDRARRALRQAVRFLRVSLGDGIVVERGRDELGLDPGGICCDAVAFADRLGQGDLAGALALYRGDLLAGLYVADAAPELEQWLDAERSSLRRRAAEAASKLSIEPPEGFASEAVSWARRAVDLAPDDEVMLRRLLLLLEDQGNRLGALRIYDEFAGRLAREFDTEPSVETRAVAQRLRAREVTGAPPWSPPPAPESASPSIRPSEPVLTEKPPGARSGTRWLTFLAGAAVVSVGIAVLALRQAPRRLPPADPALVAVMPFRVGGADASLEYLKEGMADLLAAKLTNAGGLHALDPRATIAEWRRVSATTEVLNHAVLGDVARRLGAGRMVVGEVIGTSPHLMLQARLLTPSGGRALAEASVEGPLDSLATLVDRLAVQLLSFGGSPGVRPLAELATASLPALRFYLDGRSQYRRGHYREARASFQAALDRDSTFALAAIGALTSAISIDATAWWRALGQAWAHRDRLGSRDRALLAAYAGPRYPLRSSSLEMLRGWEALVATIPDQAEAWYELGDLYYHRGAALRQPDARQRAAAAFRRASALDSTFAAPLQAG